MVDGSTLPFPEPAVSGIPTMETTMTRFPLAAGALLCALSLGACNTADLTALNNYAAGATPNLPPSAVVSDVLGAAGVSASGQATVNAKIVAVQKAAEALCRIKPLASGIGNIAIALSPSLSVLTSSGVAQQIGGAATIACNALAAAPTYTGYAHRKGELVTAYVDIGRFHRVPVYGIRQ